jgi:adenine-specific DNA-methyltransferase
MMDRKQKLELTWIGKENRPRLEPRILLEDEERSYRARQRMGDKDIFDNRLIFGDNLLALKALEQEFTGKIKCVFIDPPYNTGVAFEQYDDGLEHSLWLTLMRDRLEIIHRLLRLDGSLWVTLDDNEVHYLKVLVDEIFGRSCFIADIAWQKRDGPPNDRKIGTIHDHVLVWGKTKPGNSKKKTLAEETFNLMPRTEKADAQYQIFPEPDGPDPRGPFRKIDTTANAKGGRYVESLFYSIKNPYTGEEVWPRKGTCWRHSKEDMAKLEADKRLYWGVKGTATTPMRKLFKDEAKQGMTAPSIWGDTGYNQHASAHLETLFGEKAAFETPKPEQLLSRIVHIATSPGDWVLDSFAGSGTTGTVAHKMDRRWIMVELGEHCHTHIIPRMKKVIDGEDPGGITQAVNWQGGGGFRYYRLAPSLLEKDTWGNWIISKEYNPTMLASAMAKHEGFVYNPDEAVYWKQGKSTEKDFIFTTTNFITIEYLDGIREEMQPDESLLICCKSFQDACQDRYENITVKKIPNMLLGRCEFGREDYSLNIPTTAEPNAGMADDGGIPEETPTRPARRKPATNQPGLFDKGGE